MFQNIKELFFFLLLIELVFAGTTSVGLDGPSGRKQPDSANAPRTVGVLANSGCFDSTPRGLIWLGATDSRT